MKRKFPATRATLIYLVFGISWILLSDRLAEFFFEEFTSLSRFQTFKGLAYVGLTAALVYWLVARAARRISAQENRYRELFELSPDAMFVLGKRGRILDANRVALERYGYAYAELLGLSVRELAALSLRTRAQEKFKEVFEHPTVFEWRHRRKNGEEFPVEVHASPIQLGKARYVLSSVRDVSEREETEKMLRLQALVLDQIQDRVTVTDLDGVVTYVNQAEVQTFGRPREEIVGKTVQTYGEDPARGATQREILEKTRAHGHWRGEVVNYAEDGSEVILDARTTVVTGADGQPLALCGIATDITAQRRTEAELRESRERYRAVTENFPKGAVFLFDAELRYLFVDGRGLQDVNLSREELLGKTLFEVFPEEVCSIAAPHARATLEGRTGRYETEFAGRVYENFAVPIFQNDGQIREGLVITLEITDRKRAEEALKESEEKYRLLAETARDLIVLHDLDGRILYVNRAALDFLQLSRDTVLFSNVMQYLPEERHPEVEARAVRRRSGQGETHLYETELLNAARERIPIEASSSQFTLADGTTAVLVVARDIRERKRSERALRQSEQRYRTYVDHSPVAIFIMDETSRCIDVNEAACEMLQHSRDELLNMSALELVLAADDADPAHALALLKQDGRLKEEWRMRRKDNRLIDVTFEAVALDGGRFMAFVSDVTERRALQAQLQQGQKMKAVGQLAGGVAHDFNNLLQVISGHTDLVLSMLPPDSEFRDELEEVAKAGERAARLVAQLLAFSRRQIMQPEDLDLNEVVTELLRMVRRVIGEHIQLDFMAGHELGTIHADRGMLEQVLVNLCVNARDAMDGPGNLTIETENVAVNGEYCATHPWAQPGRYVLLRVTDTGCGMDQVTLERIFEPFFTTKERGKGTGLGLATVYGIVRQHGGMIQAYSELGKGTTVKVYLPIVERRAISVGTRVEGPVLCGDETILLAEDDPMVRNLAKTILERAGYTVLQAEDGEEAVALYGQHEGEVALLLLDVVMPGMGGRAVYERIREIRPDIPALFTSGYSENAIHTNFVLEDGLTLLPKPFAREALLRAVRKVLDGDQDTSVE